MKNRILVPTLIPIFLFSTLTLLDGGCSSGGQIGNAVTATSTLAINPNSTNVALGGSVPFTATGGVPYSSNGISSYIFAVTQGTGTIVSTTGMYTAPQTDETDTISVTDSTNTVAYATVVVGGSTGGACSVGTNGLQICPGSASVAEGLTYQFTASGGTGLDYTFTMSQGNGIINSTGLYTAPEFVETDTVKLTDSAGDVVTAQVSVTANGSTLNSIPLENGAITGVQQTCNSSTNLCTFDMNWSLPSGNAVVTVINPSTGQPSLYACTGSTSTGSAPWVQPGYPLTFYLYDSNDCAANVGLSQSPYSEVVTTATSTATDVITIQSASYGANVSSGNTGNATSYVAASCNGAVGCAYYVMVDVLGDPAPGQEKTFEISYTCSANSGTTKSGSLPAEANGNFLILSCP